MKTWPFSTSNCSTIRILKCISSCLEIYKCSDCSVISEIVISEEKKTDKHPRMCKLYVIYCRKKRHSNQQF